MQTTPTCIIFPLIQIFGRNRRADFEMTAFPVLVPVGVPVAAGGTIYDQNEQRKAGKAAVAECESLANQREANAKTTKAKARNTEDRA